jgi:hypothetical protein
MYGLGPDMTLIFAKITGNEVHYEIGFRGKSVFSLPQKPL